MEKKKKIHATNNTFCQKDKSYEVLKTNLQSEHKRMHKFMEVAFGEREMSLTTFFVTMINVMKKSNLHAEH